MISNKAAGLAVAALLSALAIQTGLAMSGWSPTSDEFSHHVASGYSYVVTRDFRMNPASPPLPRMLSGLPLLFLGANAPLNHPSWREGDSPEFARQFFYVYNDNADDLIFWARVPILILSLLFGLAVFLFSRKLFGNAGGLASLVLYVFCPDVVAHSGLATADLAVAFFFFLTLAAFLFYLREPTDGRLVLTGVAAGLAFLSKFSAALIFPVLLLIALFSGKRGSVSFGKTLAFLFVCFFTVWAGYCFEVKPLLKNTPDPPKKMAFLNKLGGPMAVRLAQDLPIPLSTFSSAIVSMSFTRAAGTNAFLMGEWSTKGWWYYYFVAFLIKNTIPFILLAILGFLMVKKLGVDRATAATLTLPVVFFFVVTLPDRAQAGIRYFLPIYPLLMVLGGGAVSYFLRQGKLLKTVALGLLVWHAVESVRIFPDYLAYFNQFIGGPRNGYRYLRDSNIDWGQDLKGLGKLVEKEGWPRVTLFFFGSADPAYYKIPYRRMEITEYTEPRPEVYAIGAHHMDTVVWTETLKPDKIVGHSIFVYDLRNKAR